MNTSEEHLNIILNKLDGIQTQIDEIKESNEKMSVHIDFVNMVFNTVRIPFFTLMNMTSRFLNGDDVPTVDQSYLIE